MQILKISASKIQPEVKNKSVNEDRIWKYKVGMPK